MSSATVVQDGFNPGDALSTLKLVTKPIPKPSPGQVVVHVTLRPINPTDYLSIRKGSTVNGTPGSEGFGIVHAVGEGVTKFHKGQRVVPILGQRSRATGNGSYQKYVSLDAGWVWPVPDDMSDEVAAQFVINPFTSYSLLHELQVPKGEYLLQSAAGSTIGKQLITLAKHYGIKTINIVRRSEQKAELKALGADEVISTKDEDLVARVKEITGGKGAWAALDAVCGTMTALLMASVKDGGRVLVYGVLGGMNPTLYSPDLFRDISLTAFAITNKILNNAEKSLACAAAVAPLVGKGIISVAEVEKIDLSEFKQAMVKAEEPGRSGKILLVSP